MYTPPPQFFERLLRQVVTNPAQDPEFLCKLAPLEVIMLGHFFTDSAHRTLRDMCADKHEGRDVLPCFMSHETLCTAGFGQQSCLAVPFTKFLMRCAQPAIPSSWIVAHLPPGRFSPNR